MPLCRASPVRGGHAPPARGGCSQRRGSRRASGNSTPRPPGSTTESVLAEAGRFWPRIYCPDSLAHGSHAAVPLGKPPAGRLSGGKYLDEEEDQVRRAGDDKVQHGATPRVHEIPIMPGMHRINAWRVPKRATHRNWTAIDCRKKQLALRFA